MRRYYLVILGLLVVGCDASVSPLLPTLSFIVPVPPLPAVFAELDGQWVLADDTGGRSCLVIQESRVSIFDRTCSTDGRGFVTRITSAPKISRAGDQISLSVTYLADMSDSVESRLAFSGRLQIDGSFIGIRIDERRDEDAAARQRSAIMSRH